ncbi:unnamed protein product, partial [Vitis vinifera]|uniref:Uncharacterized protein n=1 Tax=Vitis vinifera TaxID=29760 RepID=E0CVR7_VITVI
MDVKGLSISHIKSHLQMYRSMKHEQIVQGITSTLLIHGHPLHCRVSMF